MNVSLGPFSYSSAGRSTPIGSAPAVTRPPLAVWPLHIVTGNRSIVAGEIGWRPMIWKSTRWMCTGCATGDRL
jgi:hypothetical protein